MQFASVLLLLVANGLPVMKCKVLDFKLKKVTSAMLQDVEIIRNSSYTEINVSSFFLPCKKTRCNVNASCANIGDHAKLVLQNQ